METNNSWIDFFIFLLHIFRHLYTKNMQKRTQKVYIHTPLVHISWPVMGWKKPWRAMFYHLSGCRPLTLCKPLTEKSLHVTCRVCLCGCVCLCVCVFLPLIVSCLCACGVFTRDLCLVVVHLNSLAKEQMSAANPQNGDNKDHHHYQPLHHQITQDNIAWVSLKGLFIQTFHFKKHPD